VLTDVVAAVEHARRRARTFLETVSGIDIVVPYDGSIVELRTTGLSLSQALCRIAAHHYFHIGEIATKREQLGEHPGAYPGALLSCS
jgi:hypothetical protein